MFTLESLTNDNGIIIPVQLKKGCGMKEGVRSRCPCVVLVYTPVRQRGCLTLKEGEDAQSSHRSTVCLVQTPRVQAPQGLQGTTSFIFSQTRQSDQGKDALGPEHKCPGGSPQGHICPCTPVSLWPGVQSTVNSRVTHGALGIPALRGQPVMQQRSAGPPCPALPQLPRCPPALLPAQ